MPHSILFVEDDPQTLRNLVDIFEALGFIVVGCAGRDEVEQELTESATFDLAILDGNLGDKKYDSESESGKIILDLLVPKGISYGRFSSDMDRIPKELHGEITVEKTVSRVGTDQLVAAVETFFA